MKRSLLALSILLLFSTCAAYKAQHAVAPASSSRSEHASHEAAPKADDKIVAALASQPAPIRAATLISEIDKLQSDLKAEGKYECCVTPACRQCAITAGECHCRHSIAKDGPCCGECTQAWVEGRGDVPGVDREQVLAHLGCVRELYEKKVPEGVAPPAQRKDDDQH